MSGRRSTLCADLRKHFHDTLPALLPVLLSICLTQAAWIGIYDCKVIRNIFLNETKGFLNEWGSITHPNSHAATAKSVAAFCSGLMCALIVWNFKRILKSWQTLSWVACSFLVSGVIIMDGASRLPVGEAAQLVIGGAATAVYGGCAVLAFFAKLMPARCHQLFVVSDYEIIVVLGPFGALAQTLLRDYGADTLHLTIHSSVAAPGGAVAGDDDDDDEAVAFGRPARRLAAGRDHQLPRECGKNILPIRRQLHDSSDEEGDEWEPETDQEEEQGCAELGFGLLVYISLLVGSSMAVGVLPALATTAGALGGVAYVMSIPSEEFLPATAISIGGGVMGHAIGLAAMAAIGYVV